MAAQYAELDIEPGARFDQSFLYTQGDVAHTPISLARFTPHFYLFRDGALAVSDIAPPGGAALTKEPGGVTGWIDLSIAANITRTFLHPYGAVATASFRLELVDNHDATSVIRLLAGPINVLQETP